MIIEYHRTHFNSHPPTRGNPSDAGLDVYFSPKEREAITIEPGQSVILSTGLKNRSSVASKRSLIVGACVVDSGYDGEVFVNLHNIGTEPQIVEPHTKIAQVVMTPVVSFRALETTNPDLYGWYPITISERGDGALGSTDAND